MRSHLSEDRLGAHITFFLAAHLVPTLADANFLGLLWLNAASIALVVFWSQQLVPHQRSLCGPLHVPAGRCIFPGFDFKWIYGLFGDEDFWAETLIFASRHGANVR